MTYCSNKGFVTRSPFAFLNDDVIDPNSYHRMDNCRSWKIPTQLWQDSIAQWSEFLHLIQNCGKTEMTSAFGWAFREAQASSWRFEHLTFCGIIKSFSGDLFQWRTWDNSEYKWMLNIHKNTRNCLNKSGHSRLSHRAKERLIVVAY